MPGDQINIVYRDPDEPDPNWLQEAERENVFREAKKQQLIQETMDKQLQKGVTDFKYTVKGEMQQFFEDHFSRPDRELILSALWAASDIWSSAAYDEAAAMSDAPEDREAALWNLKQFKAAEDLMIRLGHDYLKKVKEAQENDDGGEASREIAGDPNEQS